MENLISRLLIEESRSSTRDEQESAVAFKLVEKKCFKCGNIGHIAKKCKNGDKNKRCYLWNKEGHYASDCIANTKRNKEKQFMCSICKKDNIKKRTYFRQKNEKKEKKTQKHNTEISFLTKFTEESSNIWIMNSGTTSHM